MVVSRRCAQVGQEALNPGFKARVGSLEGLTREEEISHPQVLTMPETCWCQAAGLEGSEKAGIIHRKNDVDHDRLMMYQTLVYFGSVYSKS